MREHEFNTIDEQLERLDDIGRLVRALPEDVPSLAWRSALNEKLRHVQPRSPKRRLSLAWLGGSAIAGAAAITMFFLFKPSGPTEKVLVSDAGLEAAIMAAHEESAGAYEVTVAGASLRPTKLESLDEELDWTTVEHGSL
jgi:hypothetical protein